MAAARLVADDKAGLDSKGAEADSELVSTSLYFSSVYWNVISCINVKYGTLSL